MKKLIFITTILMIVPNTIVSIEENFLSPNDSLQECESNDDTCKIDFYYWEVLPE